MSLASTLWNITKGTANATGLPFLVNTSIVNPLKSVVADITDNDEAYRNAEKFYAKPTGDQLKQWGGSSAAALLPFIGGNAIGRAGKLVPQANLAQKSLFGAASGGLLGGAMNLAGTVGIGQDPTLSAFGQGAAFGGLIGGVSPLARAAYLSTKSPALPTVRAPRAREDEIRALRGYLDEHYGLTPGGPSKSADLKVLHNNVRAAADRLKIPLNNGNNNNQDIIREFLDTLGKSASPKYSVPEPEVTSRMWRDYFTRAGVKGNGLTGQGAMAPVRKTPAELAELMRNMRK